MPATPAKRSSRRKLPLWTHATAGVLAGSASCTLLYPTDLVRVKMQVDVGVVDGRGLAASRPVGYGSTLESIRTVAHADGWRGLYRGLSPALFGSAVSWGLYFSQYERSKRRYADGGALGHAAASAEAAAVTVVATNPVWVIKTRLQLQTSAEVRPSAYVSRPAAYRGALDALRTILRDEGAAGLFRGLTPALVVGVAHGGVQFSVYEQLKALAQRRRDGEEPHWAVPALNGAISKMAANFVTYPLQVVRSRLHQRGGVDRGGIGLRAPLVEIGRMVRVEGWRAFFKGLSPTLLRVAPSGAISFLVYENVVKAFRTNGL